MSRYDYVCQSTLTYINKTHLVEEFQFVKLSCMKLISIDKSFN